MRPVYRGPPPPRVTALRNTRGTRPVSYNYHALGARLLGAIGEYCSYCEAPLSSNAAVEHIVSKSTATDLETAWDNFLLACVNCNSTKGAVKVQTVDDLKSFIWPCTPVDTNVGGSTYYSSLDAFVYELDPAGNAIVKAAPGVKQAAAQRTLAMVGLDKAPDADPAMRDRRILNRTAAWALAGEIAAKYAPYLADNGRLTSEFAGLFEAQIIEVAKVTGFWSVWVAHFNAMLQAKAGMAPDTRLSVLTRLLCVPFPGTYAGDNLPALPANYTGLPAIT